MIPRTLAFCLLALTTATAQAQTPLCDRIRALTQDPTVAAAHWGIQVSTLDGASLCGINQAQLFRPASNAKIFTTATALALLGPTHTITTRLVAEGTIANGTLTGDLKLIGAGDANFGAHNIPYLAPANRPKNPVPPPPTIADIEELASQVAAKGIKTITGNIIGDDTYFAWQPYPPDWSIDDMIYGYGAPVSALTIHDNQIDFTVTPNPPTPTGSAKATVSLIPAVPYYDLQSSVYSIAFSGGCDDRIAYQRAVGSKTLNIFGDIAPTIKACNQAIAIQDPAEYAAQALKLALERRGIQITGTATMHHYDARILGGVFTERPDNDFILRRLFTAPGPHQPYECVSEPSGTTTQTTTQPVNQAINHMGPVDLPTPPTELATHISPTLLEDMTFTNKVSQNLHAELFLRTLGASFSCDRSQRDGLHVVRQYILYAGVDPHDFVLYDGSGLSGHDLVAPRAIARFLSFAAAQPWFSQWRATLPEGGVDGSLASRFPGDLKGRVHAKTGTLGESRALSGYLTTTSGQTLIFSILVDNHLPGSADRVVMDKIVTTIAGQN